eukprot:844832_1
MTAHLSPDRTRSRPNIFDDERLIHLKMMNFIGYLQRHGYTGIVLTSHLRRYVDNVSSAAEIEYFNSPQYQKVFGLHQFISSFDWIVWTDWDTIWYDCSKSIEEGIIKKNEDLSFIFSGDHSYLNSGVFALKNTKWSHQLLNRWVHLVTHPLLYHIQDIPPSAHREQTLLVGLLCGYDPYANDDWTVLRDLVIRQYP